MVTLSEIAKRSKEIQEEIFENEKRFRKYFENIDSLFGKEHSKVVKKEMINMILKNM